MRKARLLSAVLAGDARWVGAVARAPDLLDVGRAARLVAVGQLMAVVDQELEEVQVEVMDEEADEAYQIPLDED